MQTDIKGKYIPPKQAEDGDSDGKSDEGEGVSDGVHGFHIGVIEMKIDSPFSSCKLHQLSQSFATCVLPPILPFFHF